MGVVPNEIWKVFLLPNSSSSVKAIQEDVANMETTCLIEECPVEYLTGKEWDLQNINPNWHPWIELVMTNLLLEWTAGTISRNNVRLVRVSRSIGRCSCPASYIHR